MMRLVITGIVCLIPFLSVAKDKEKKDENKVFNNEAYLLGGYKFNEGTALSLGYYYNISFIQVGGGLETVYEASTQKMSVLPGFNINLKIPFIAGYIYPGVTVRYKFGSNYNGPEFGGTLGGVVFITQQLGVNVETGYRVYSAPVNDVTGVRDANNYVPVMVGVRYRF